MTIEEVDKRNNLILENAKLWAKGESCLPLEPIDIVVLGGYLNIRIPNCFHHFMYSDNPNYVSATGAFKTILKTLDKLKKALL